MKCGLRDSGNTPTSRTFRRGFLCEHATFHPWGRLRGHTWWFTVAQVMSDSILVENQHRTTEQVQHFSATAETWKSHSPYISPRHTALHAYHQFWCLLGVPGNWYHPEIQQQINSEKSNLVFFQDRDKVASVKSFTAADSAWNCLAKTKSRSRENKEEEDLSHSVAVSCL